MTDLVFLKALRDKLKGGNTRSIHLNVLPGRFASRLDIASLNYVAPGTSEKFLDILLSKASFEFKISFDNIDFNKVPIDEQKRLGLLSKRLNSLYIENEDSFKDHGLKTFGFGYPIIMKRSRQDPSKLIKAPLFIWPLEIVKSYNKVNAWSILRNKTRNEQGKIVDEEVHSVGLNEVLISFIKTDEDISIAQINDDLLEDAIIDKNELISTCVEVLKSMNAADAGLGEELANKFNEPLNTIPDANHFDSVTGSKAWIHFGGVFGLFRTQKESIITDIDKLIERFDEFEFEDLITGGFFGTPFSAVKTDPSQQELLSTLGTDPKKIIQGPPGTGKSQSLTALITNALANQLKCLVVCEKKTALDVIKQNLKRENEQMGELAAVIEDINKDRDGIVNSVRERLTSMSGVPYFNQRIYDNTRENVEITSRLINQQHSTLAEKIYEGKNWTALVGEYLTLQEKADPLVFKDRLDYKSFLFDKDQNELHDTLQVLKDAKKLFSPVKQFDHPLAVLHDNIFDLPNVAEIILTIEKHLSDLNMATGNITGQMDAHTNAINEWMAKTCNGYSAAVANEIKPYLPYLFGDPISEQQSLPDFFALEKFAMETIDALTQQAAVIDGLLFQYKEWLKEHYASYYESLIKVTDEYTRFADDNCTKYGKVFLNNSGFSRFKTNVLAIFSGKYKAIKANRIALIEKFVMVQQVHAINEYVKHIFLASIPNTDLRAFVENIRTLKNATMEWYTGAEAIINDYWTSTSSSRLHAKYQQGTAAIKHAGLSYTALREEIIKRCGFELLEPAAANLHAIKAAQLNLIAGMDGISQQFRSFRTGYAGFVNVRLTICTNFDELMKQVDKGRVINHVAIKPLNLVQARMSISAINKCCDVINANLEGFRDYYHWQIFFREQSPLRQAVIKAAIVSGCEDWQLNFHAWYLNWLLSIHEKRELPKSDDKIIEFRAMKDQFRNLQISNIFNHWQTKQANAVRELQRNGLSPTSLFNKRGTRGEKRNSLRKIVQISFELFTNFFPVVMVSPSVCSSILPLQEGVFDIIIFDEASQLRLEDTFPALVRGKIKVISGDSQQMPPSSYFQGGASVLNPGEEDDEEDGKEMKEQELGMQRRKVNHSIELAESESLLVYAENCNYKQSYLKIHYRSQHPYLIDFSNNAFYGKRLIPMPANSEYRPIRVIEVNGIYEESVNRDEAIQVVDILLREIKPFSNGKYPSVGIATFNLYQRNLILEEITRVRQLSIENDKKINDLGSDLFVKNLENIQGDERDVIIISTTFGKRMDGSFRQFFGPIMQRNGYKLLNVIITRAKHQVYLCTSIPRDNINTYSSLLQQNRNMGRGVFYAYIAYAIAVSEGNHDTRQAILDQLYENCDAKLFDIENGVLGSESPFEDEVYYRLAKRMGQQRLEQQFKIGGFRIDLMIRSEKTGQPFIAIECDGAKYHSSNEAYAWDMFRQDQLEQYGLFFYRIWSTNWWIAPEKEMRKLMEFIQSKEAEESSLPVQPPFVRREEIVIDNDIVEVTSENFDINIPTTHLSELLPGEKTENADKILIEQIQERNQANPWVNPEAPLLIGTRYKEQLILSNSDVAELNKLDPWTNSFTGIEYCMLSTIGLYIPVIKRLNQSLKEISSSLDLEIKKLKDIISPNYNSNTYGNIYYGSLDYVKQRACSLIFKFCENKIRQQYGHKRKINTDGLFFNGEADALFNQTILPCIMESLEALQPSIPVPDTATEIELNAQNTLRWKTSFEKLIAAFTGDADAYFSAVCDLGKQNQKNPSVENIYYDASKFIAVSDKATSLKLYLYYVHADLQSEKVDSKQLNKTLQKNLFKNKEEFVVFENIVNRLITSKDLNAALLETDSLEQLSKRRIIIDRSAIASVEAQHSGTVALLNEYLADEKEVAAISGAAALPNGEDIMANDEIQIQVSMTFPDRPVTGYLPQLTFTSNQISTLNYFAMHNFTVEHGNFEQFAKSTGSFKSQLVDSLNETCFELFDDNLISEEEELYIMSADYYQTLLQI